MTTRELESRAGALIDTSRCSGPRPGSNPTHNLALALNDLLDRNLPLNLNLCLAPLTGIALATCAYAIEGILATDHTIAFTIERNDMAWFWQKSLDWCHICGTVQDKNVEIVYPTNAEHQWLGKHGEGSHGGPRKFLRICADRGETIVRIGRGAMAEAARNNPDLVTRHMKCTSPYLKPDLN